MNQIEFAFPLPRVHTGVHLANGRMGVLVWGTTCLCLTVAHAGFWDRRGARPFATPMNYRDMKGMLLGGLEQHVRDAFQEPNGSPYQIGGGRIELHFGEVTPCSATLNTLSGILSICMSNGEEVLVFQSMTTNVLGVEVPDSLKSALDVRVRPSWEWTSEVLAVKGVDPPTLFATGFCQSTPDDASLTVGYIPTSKGMSIFAELGCTPFEELCNNLRLVNQYQLQSELETYWAAFWSRIPPLPATNLATDELVHYSIWKLACVTAPGGIAATLQGPWMEEHRLPLWSNDYHFNINLQMMYWPCLHLGLGDHMRPLWKMIHSWLPQIFANGEFFFGVKGAAMLPHAVDDRCHPIGSYWQGTIDHASTAWTALMAWLDYDKHGDRWVLEEIAWPLLSGAFEGYYAMLEDVGCEYRLPISVSPEFGEGAMGTWGPNASFQLAAIHMLCQRLPLAASSAGHPIDARWSDVASRLPRYSLSPVPLGVYDDPNQAARYRIGLWEGFDLPESHRHHSHLAGIYPFESLDLQDSLVINHSFHHLATLGGGAWSAWGTIWAVCLMSRVGWNQGAKAWLAFFIQASSNEGKSFSAGGARGTFISWGSADVAREHEHEGDHEVMQLDANLGFITAVFETCGY